MIIFQNNTINYSALLAFFINSHPFARGAFLIISVVKNDNHTPTTKSYYEKFLRKLTLRYIKSFYINIKVIL